MARPAPPEDLVECIRTDDIKRFKEYIRIYPRSITKERYSLLPKQEPTKTILELAVEFEAQKCILHLKNGYSGLATAKKKKTKHDRHESETARHFSEQVWPEPAQNSYAPVQSYSESVENLKLHGKNGISTDELFRCTEIVIEKCLDCNVEEEFERLFKIYLPLLSHEHTSRTDQTSFMLVCKFGNFKLVEKLISCHEKHLIKLDFTKQDKYGDTALHYFAQMKPNYIPSPQDWLSLQSKMGLEITKRDKFFQNALFLLVKEKNMDILELYLKNEPNIKEGHLELFGSKKGGMNVVHVCARYSSIRKLQKIINEDAFDTMLHEKYKNSTCLHFACKSTERDMCECEETCSNERRSYAQCNIHFLAGHKCNNQNSFTFYAENHEGKNCVQIRRELNLLQDLEVLDVIEELALLDQCNLVDMEVANANVEKQFGFQGKPDMEFSTAIRACRAAFNFDDENIMTNFVSSSFFKETSKITFIAEFVSRSLVSQGNGKGQKILFPDMNNGFKPIQETLANNELTKQLSLLGIAVKTGRFKICKILLITEQINVIPNCLKTMLECQYLKQNNKIKNDSIERLQTFCETVFHNAIDELHRGADAERRILVFQYIMGMITDEELPDDDSTDGSMVKCLVPGSNVKVGPKFDTFDLTNQKDPKTIMQMIENLITLAEIDTHANDVRFKNIFTIPCFVKMQKWLWKKCPMPSKRNKNFDRQLPYYSFKIFIDFIFLGIYTIYILAGMYEDLPARDPWTHKKVNELWPDEKSQNRYSNLISFQRSTTIAFEVMLILYWFGILVEEIREVFCIISDCERLHCRKIRGYRLWLNLWNCADVVYLVTFFISFAIRFRLYSLREQEKEAVHMKPHKILEYRLDGEMVSIFWARVFLAMAYTCICFRRMHHVGMWYKPLGVLYITFQELLQQDLFPFFIMLVINILSSGVFFNALLYPGGYKFFPNGTLDMHKMSSIIDVYTRPSLVAFGEYNLDDLQKCYSYDTMFGKNPSAPSIEYRETDECTYPLGTFIYTNIVIFFFMIIVNLTMFNLLIARFSLTVTRYNEAATSIYYWGLYLRYKEMVKNNIYPPPFNIISVIRNSCIRMLDKFDKYGHNKVAPEDWETGDTWKRCKNYRQFLFHQAISFSEKRNSFTNPIYEVAKEVDCAVDKMQTCLLDNLNQRNDNSGIINQLQTQQRLMNEKLNSIESMLQTLIDSKK